MSKFIERRLKICLACQCIRKARRDNLDKYLLNCYLSDTNWYGEKVFETSLIPEECQMKFEYMILDEENETHKDTQEPIP